MWVAVAQTLAGLALIGGAIVLSIPSVFRRVLNHAARNRLRTTGHADSTSQAVALVGGILMMLAIGFMSVFFQ